MLMRESLLASIFNGNPFPCVKPIFNTAES